MFIKQISARTEQRTENDTPTYSDVLQRTPTYSNVLLCLCVCACVCVCVCACVCVCVHVLVFSIEESMQARGAYTVKQSPHGSARYRHTNMQGDMHACNIENVHGQRPPQFNHCAMATIATASWTGATRAVTSGRARTEAGPSPCPSWQWGPTWG